MMKLTKLLLISLAGSVVSAASAEPNEVAIVLYEATTWGEDKAVGEVQLTDSPFGLLITPDLQGLTPGPYAMHIHENPSCSSSAANGDVILAGAAGGHFDPQETGRHEGPYGHGHLGDLPVLVAEKDGRAVIPVLAPRVRIADVRGRALMIHAGADRYAVHAAHPHGKGGARLYCGIFDEVL